MPSVVLERDEAGKLRPTAESDMSKWQRFQAATRAMSHGDSIRLTWALPRSPKHHRLFFAFLGRLHSMQERFEDADHLRQWLVVGAGYCDLVPGPAGQMVAIPRSLAWERMDETEFGELHVRVREFACSPHALQFLWPHSPLSHSYRAMDNLLLEFDR